MKKLMMMAMMILFINHLQAQNKLSGHELSINLFRNPSIGAEYRFGNISFHGGYYPTAFDAGETTSFIKLGMSVWFLPVGKKENPSSFYSGASYLRGLNRAYESKNAIGVEGGFRWMVWKGLNLRIGAIAVMAKDESFKINPTPGVSYSFYFK
ncbi:MAG: hypothetical protein M3R25_00895 [Bacteroidota bacterium]|nr:hypothetical protein [Bacteroidota bacterium]